MVGFVKSPEQPLQKDRLWMGLMAAAPLQGSGRGDWPNALVRSLPPFWCWAHLEEQLISTPTLNVQCKFHWVEMVA